MKTIRIQIPTQGNTDIIDITQRLQRIAAQENMQDGIIFLNVLGSTVGLTTMEFETGLEHDLKAMFEKVLPFRSDYRHNATWSDDNGHAHMRSSFLKTNFFVTVTAGKLDLGVWQQVVLIDFDTRPREREIIVKLMMG